MCWLSDSIMAHSMPILVAHPFEPPETRVCAIFNEDFKLLITSGHEWENHTTVNSSLLSDSPVLMLGEGHCFRDQVLETCTLGQQSPNAMPGSSLMTLRHIGGLRLGANTHTCLCRTAND